VVVVSRQTTFFLFTAAKAVSVIGFMVREQ